MFFKNWFLRCRPKCSRPIRLQDFLINCISGTKSIKSLIFACCHRFFEIKSWFKNIGMTVVKNECGNSGLRTLKLAVFQTEINQINWFLVCWYKFRKTKLLIIKVHNFWMVVVKNVCGILSLGFLKSALSQEWIDEISWFFACRYKTRKTKSYFDNYWLCMVKNWWGLIDHGTLKLGVSHYLFN